MRKLLIVVVFVLMMGFVGCSEIPKHLVDVNSRNSKSIKHTNDKFNVVVMNKKITVLDSSGTGAVVSNEDDKGFFKLNDSEILFGYQNRYYGVNIKALKDADNDKPIIVDDSNIVSSDDLIKLYTIYKDSIDDKYSTK
jgi:hypothetical protein